MVVYYKTSHRGNLALETQIWELPILVAKQLIKDHPTVSQKGTYWESVLVKPCRRAVRAKQAFVKVYTAGFSTGNLASMLAQSNFSAEFAGDVA